MNGILNLIKPSGMTSHDVVDYARKLFPKVKIGHTGTLDPAASGVLILCLGKATRISSFLLEGKKGYRAVIKFGITTDTLDCDGKELTRKKANNIDFDKIESLLDKFRGEIEQIPPAYSAVRHQGKRLYELARIGESVVVPPRKINIYNLKIVDFFHSSFPELVIDIECSHGTYIRSLASDLGEGMGCGAHLSFLVRTFSGAFELANALTLDELKNYVLNKEVEKVLLPMESALMDFNKVTVIDKALFFLSNGNMLFPEQIIAGNDFIDNRCLLRIYDEKNNFRGLGRWQIINDKMMFKTEKLLSDK